MVMMITPLVSTMAEFHESEHLTAGDAHFDTESDHGVDVNPDQNNDVDESGLHFLAHASHCCGHIVALLPDPLYLVLMPVQSVPSISRGHSLTAFLSISHFRPPIAS